MATTEDEYSILKRLADEWAYWESQRIEIEAMVMWQNGEL